MHVYEKGEPERGSAAGPAVAGPTGEPTGEASVAADPTGAGPTTDGPAAGVLAMLAAGGPTLADVLEHLAELAARLAPQADGIALVVRRPDGGAERVLTGRVGEVERLQAELGEGPAVEAARSGRVAGSDDLRAERGWPALAGRLAPTGPRSALCVPLSRHGVVLGHVGAYADAAGAFGDRERHLAARWAGAAAQACQEALQVDQERQTRRLQLDDDDRATVDRAVAVLAAQDGVGPDEALAVLEMLASTEQQDLAAVARAVAAGQDGGTGDPGPPR